MDSCSLWIFCLILTYCLTSLAFPINDNTSADKNFTRNEGILYRSKNLTVSVISHYLNNLETIPVNVNCSIFDDNLRKYRQFVIFLAISESYFSTFLNWLIYYDNVCPNSLSYLYIECMDKSVNSSLKAIGLQCSNTEVVFGLNYIWLYRSKVIHALLRSHIDVLITDADALWLRNPFPYIQEHITYASIISSRATYPTYVSQLLGATICMGFLYIKVDYSSRYIWNQLMKAITIRRDGDDQRELNRLLVTLNISYPVKPFIENSNLSNIGNVINSNYSLDTKVVLLPHEDFRRKCSNNNQTNISLNQIIVAHCISPKNMSSKFNTAVQFGLWRVIDSWNDTIENHKKYENNVTTQNVLLKMLTNDSNFHLL